MNFFASKIIQHTIIHRTITLLFVNSIEYNTKIAISS